MRDLSEQIVAGQNIEVKTTQQTKPNTVLLYIICLIYLLIPVLSTESALCWSIGIIGIYKTAKLYRNNEEKKN